MTLASREWVRPIDPAVGLYLVVAVLVVVQVVVLGSGERTVRGALPYLAAMLALIGIGYRRKAGSPDAHRRRHVADPDGADPRSGRAVAIMAITAAVLGSWAVVQFLWALPIGIGAPNGFYRVKSSITSPVGDHNTLAGLLLVGVVAALATAARDRRYLVAAGLCCLGVVACLSRGAAAVLVLVAVVGAVVASTRALRWTLPIAAVVTMLGVLGFATLLDAAPPPGGVTSRGPVGASVLARADLAERGIEVARERPFIGAGLGAFAEQAHDLPPPNDHAHQLLAHAAAEGGLVLLVVVVGLPAVLLHRAWRIAASPLRDTALLGGGALVAHAQVEILGGRIGYEVLLAVLIALAGLAGRRAATGVSGTLAPEA